MYRFIQPTNYDTKNQLRNLMLSQEHFTNQRKSAKFLKLDRLAILQLETPKIQRERSRNYQSCFRKHKLKNSY